MMEIGSIAVQFGLSVKARVGEAQACLTEARFQRSVPHLFTLVTYAFRENEAWEAHFFRKYIEIFGKCTLTSNIPI